LKPLSVTLPFAARFTDGEAASRARERILDSAKAETVTVAGRVGGADAGAVCDLASDCRLGVGPVSSKWWGDGGRKKGEENNTNIQAPAFLLHHHLRVSGRDWRASWPLISMKPDWHVSGSCAVANFQKT